MITTSQVVVQTVLDKTGYSLQSGSYSIHKSNTQRVTIVMNAVTNNTASVSAITTTRATIDYNGSATDLADDSRDAFGRLSIPSTTTVRADRNRNVNDLTVAGNLSEWV